MTAIGVVSARIVVELVILFAVTYATAEAIEAFVDWWRGL